MEERWRHEGEPFEVGTVVGCMLDLECREIRFCVNGFDDDEPAFSEVSLESGYFPAMSMVSGRIEVNFGEGDFRFLREGYSAVPYHVTEHDRKAQADAQAWRAAEVKSNMRADRQYELSTILQNPDLSGALAVLEILDRVDAARGGCEAAPSQRDATESGTSGWRRASVEDYGVAMRAALEELAESDRREIERLRQEHDEIAAEVDREEEIARQAEWDEEERYEAEMMKGVPLWAWDDESRAP
ncbi:hypothetical protein JL720_392 [Aureococcus anophagefferens]|nr:hypothetical protein JL720_392 [Aureococcus anophagefferens]